MYRSRGVDKYSMDTLDGLDRIEQATLLIKQRIRQFKQTYPWVLEPSEYDPKWRFDHTREQQDQQ